MMEPHQLLIVDDDRDLASLAGEYLIEHGFAVSSAPDGLSALRHIQLQKFDLIVLDVMMPGIDGFEVLRRLRAVSQVPVLMLTAKMEGESRVRGLDGGADDYLAKPFDPPELVARIRAILRRTKFDGGVERPVEVSGIRLDPASRRVYHNEKAIDVTSFEYDILRILLRSAGRVVSRDTLMNELYGREASPFDRSIDVHISHLRKKFEGTAELIQTIRGVGYQFVLERPLSGS